MSEVSPRTTTARIIPRAEHCISRTSISESALKVLYRLKHAGFGAYLVGGGVRDLLLGREPKDFDVATDAHPEQIRELFRNCRLIGRRFRLAHVRYGRDVIEVATFRAQLEDDAEGDQHIEDGRILRDNIYGELDQDAWRRDFTVNALYYNIADFSVVDYVDGYQDLQDGVLRMIGDPVERFREDPVRMLRAVRFATKLGLRLHPDTERPMFELGHLLDDISAARLYDEVLKLFHGGYALQTFEMLRHYDLFRFLFPQTDYCLAEEEDGFPHVLLARALDNTDKRIADDKPVTPAFLFAALLWQPMHREATLLHEEGMPEQNAIYEAAEVVLSDQRRYITIPRRFTIMMREIWVMQGRLLSRRGKAALSLAAHPRFRAAYDFLLLRVEAGEPLQEHADWWTKFQETDADAQRAMLEGSSARRRRPRRRRGGRGAAKSSSDSESVSNSGPDTSPE